MATRRKTGAADTAPAEGVKPRKAASAKAPAAKAPRKRPVAVPPAPRAPANEAEAPAAAGPAGLWRASLKALDTVRQDVTRRHTNVIETLLGIAPRAEAEGHKPAPRGFPGLEGLGLRKFEDVFDQRVATALERLGMPTREEVQALHVRLDEVLAQLERLEGGAPAARRKAPAPAKKR